MTWHKERLAAFDIETTGVNVESDRIVTAAIGVIGGGRTAENRTWLVDPGVEIPAGATAVHGISTEKARSEGQPAAAAVDEITALLADQLSRQIPIVAFNARFDLTMLDREARRYGIEPLIDRVGGLDGMLVIDPLIIDKHIDRYRRGKRRLGDVCNHYGVQLENMHTAEADAIAAAEVAFRLGDVSEELGGTPVRTLFGLQAEWAAEQAKSLEEYFTKQGRPQVVDGAWPIVPFA